MHQPPLRRQGLGAGVIALGAALSAWAVPRGNLIETALAFVVLGAGFGLCHAFIARRTIAGAPAEEQAMASGAVPRPSHCTAPRLLNTFTTSPAGDDAGACAAQAESTDSKIKDEAARKRR